MSILDFSMPGMDSPEGQGLMAAAMSLLQAQKMPGQRTGIAGALGQAGQQYMQTRTSAQDMAQRRKFQDLQMRAQQEQLQAAQDERARAERMRAMIGQHAIPARAAVGANEMDAEPVAAQPAGFDFKGYAGSLAQVDPNAALDLMDKLKAKAPKQHVMSAGQRLVDESGREVFSAPEKAVPIDYNKPFLPDGSPNTAYQRYSLTKAKTGATNVTQNSVTKQEGEEAKAVGKFYGDAFADIQRAGFTAQSKINRYSRLDQLLEGVSTGKFTPTGLEIAKAASALGLNIDPNMQNKEAAQALSSEIALELRNPAGGAGMPGAMSDADRQFLVNMVPGLSTTPQGRKMMTDTAIKIATRDKQVADLARAYRKKNGNIDEGFYDELSRFSEANPLFKRAPGQNMPTASAIEAELARRRGK